MCDVLFIRVQKYDTSYKYATQKKRKATILASACSSEDAREARVWDVVQCVRACVRRERACSICAECVRRSQRAIP
jgi:hypothetical protein